MGEPFSAIVVSPSDSTRWAEVISVRRDTTPVIICSKTDPFIIGDYTIIVHVTVRYVEVTYPR